MVVIMRRSSAAPTVSQTCYGSLTNIRVEISSCSGREKNSLGGGYGGGVGGIVGFLLIIWSPQLYLG